MKKRNIFAASILFLGFIGLLLWLYTKIVTIGNNLATTTSIYLVYFYYVVVALFVLYFIVRPFFIVFFAPSYSLKKIYVIQDDKASEEKKKDNYQEMIKMSQKLINKKLVNEQNRQLLKVELASQEPLFETKYTHLKKTLNKAIKDDLQGDIRKIVVTTARDTLYFTAISQNGFADILIVLVNNFRLIKKIVQRCGFRPSFTKLVRFYVHVTISCFVAEGAQSVDMGSLLGSSIKGLAKPLAGSLIQGTVNGFFMLRAGFLARNLIFEEHDSESKEINILKSSFAQAAAALPELTVASFIDPILNVLKGTFGAPTREIVKRVWHQENPYADEKFENLNKSTSSLSSYKKATIRFVFPFKKATMRIFLFSRKSDSK